MCQNVRQHRAKQNSRDKTCLPSQSFLGSAVLPHLHSLAWLPSQKPFADAVAAQAWPR